MEHITVTLLVARTLYNGNIRPQRRPHIPQSCILLYGASERQALHVTVNIPGTAQLSNFLIGLDSVQLGQKYDPGVRAV